MRASSSAQPTEEKKEEEDTPKHMGGAGCLHENTGYNVVRMRSLCKAELNLGSISLVGL